jgi:hypothetical protein
LGNTGEPKIDWIPPKLSEDYDLLKGLPENIFEDVGFVDIDPITCLVENSPYIFSTDIDPPPAGGVIFYLARRTDDSCGFSSTGLPRVPATANCP